MPDDFQPGLHLSPDQLSAFAENALPEHERLAALTHLSDCADCRQVVFLIQQSEPTLAVAVPETPSRAWFTLPQIFSAATAALACSLILALIVHYHHVEPAPVTTAALQPPQPIASAPPAATSNSSPNTPTTESKAAKVTQASSHTPNIPQPESRIPAPKPTILAAPSPQPRSSTGAGIDTGHSVDSKQKAFDVTAAANTYAALPPQAPASAALGGAVPMPPPPQARALRAYAADKLQKDLPPTSTIAAAAPAPSSSSDMDSAQNFNGASIAGLPISNNIDVNGIIAATPIKLPSKLPSASVLQSAGRTLALDTAGSLFFSLDRGRHWSTVTPQWSGKAVRITLASAPARLYQIQPSQSQTPTGSNNGSVASTAPQTQQATVTNASFELITATGAVWISTDGLTWHAR